MEEMKGNPLVSVIVPIYNVEEYLDDAVQSLRHQTYSNLEIILVDDGSPDACGAMCDVYAQQDARIKVIHKPNGGQADARNRALDIATGEFITFLDPDDWLALNFVERCLQVFREHPYLDVVDTHYQTHPCDGSPSAIEPKGNQEVEFVGDALCEAMQGYCNIITQMVCGKLYRKEAIGDLRFQAGRISEDYLFCIHFFCRTRTISMRIITDALYHYRTNRPGGTTNSTQENMLPREKMIFDGMLEVYDTLEKEHSSRLKYVAGNYFGRLVGHYRHYHTCLRMHPERAEYYHAMLQFLGERVTDGKKLSTYKDLTSLRHRLFAKAPNLYTRVMRLLEAVAFRLGHSLYAWPKEWYKPE